MRSKLFVPASRPELFGKALAGPADGVCFDLEDAVAEQRKPAARDALREWLASENRLTAGKILIVRVNAVSSPHFVEDLACAAHPAVHWLNLPKPESPDEVRAAADALARAEREQGIERPLGLLLNIETPQALRLAPALAGAHPRVVGLQLGLGDLFEPLGIDRREVAAVAPVMMAVRLAAATAGVFAYDSAFADLGDHEGFSAEAALARRLGFLGKSCVHPSQVALANQVFQPSTAEIAHCLRVIASAAGAQAQGRGAWVVDGKMIDAPFLQRAQAVVASAQQLGLLTATSTAHHKPL
jgi:citrate lyase subunit beta/citryl-CoA lyase